MPPTPSATPTLPSEHLSVGSFIKFGWETFKKRPWFFIFAFLIFFLVSIIANIIGGIIQGLLDGSATSGFGHLIAWFIQNVTSIFVGMGTIAFFIKAHDTPETVRYMDAWRPEIFWKYLGASILLGLIIIVGFILLVIPGIIASIVFGFTLYLVVDKGLGPIEALKESARLTKGNRWRMFAFQGASGIIALLGFICLVLGIFVAIPVLALAGIEMYRRIAAAAETQTKTPLSGGEKGLVVFSFLIPLVILAIGLASAVALVALNTTGRTGSGAMNAVQLKMTQLGVEQYYAEHNAYPATLDEISAQMPNSKMDLSAYTYTTDPKHETYKLCTAAKVPQGESSCVSSEDASSTNDVPEGQPIE
jgi:Tfp pilus assembly protein PilE